MVYVVHCCSDHTVAALFVCLFTSPHSSLCTWDELVGLICSVGCRALLILFAILGEQDLSPHRSRCLAALAGKLSLFRACTGTPAWTWRVISSLWTITFRSVCFSSVCSTQVNCVGLFLFILFVVQHFFSSFSRALFPSLTSCVYPLMLACLPLWPARPSPRPPLSPSSSSLVTRPACLLWATAR